MLAYRHTGVPDPAHRLRLPRCRRSPSARSSSPRIPKEIEVREIFKKRAAEADARLKGAARLRGSRRRRRPRRSSPTCAPPTRRPSKITRRGGRGRRASRQVARGRARAPGRRSATPPPRARDRRGRTPRSSRAPTEKAQDIARKNFLALIFCLMIGTAALPHILMRYYTTPSVREARGVGDLVAVLHLPALLHRAGARGAGQVRDVPLRGRHAVRRPAGVGEVVVGGRSDAAQHRRHQRRRHRAARRDRDRRRHRGARHAGDRAACRT